MLRVNVEPYHEVIQEAAERLYRALLDSPHRDQSNDFRLWKDCRLGKKAEVAAALWLGIEPDVTLWDEAGKPDLVTPSWRYDVKALPQGKDRVSLRANVIRKGHLLVIARDRDGAHIDLLGWLHADALDTYPLRDPARGHTTPYRSVPIADLSPINGGNT